MFRVKLETYHSEPGQSSKPHPNDLSQFSWQQSVDLDADMSIANHAILLVKVIQQAVIHLDLCDDEKVNGPVATVACWCVASPL
jgi:hypothetical protein